MKGRELTILSILIASCVGGAPDVAKELTSPHIVEEGVGKKLVLPEQLTLKVQQEFSGFRTPSDQDRTGDWGNEKLHGPFPYVKWGDLDGNGLTDVAFILIGKKKWNLVIFRQVRAHEYLPVSIYGDRTDDPKDWSLGLLKRGAELDRWAFDEEKGHSYVAGKHNFEHDTITLHIKDAGSVALRWDGKQFERISLESYE